MHNDCCLTEAVHEDKVKQVKLSIPSITVLQDMAELFRVLSDETRMRIISALSDHELCVCDLSALLEVSQSAVSHQLRILRQARLVKYRREGKNAFYTLDDEHIQIIVNYAREHVLEAFSQN